MIDASWFIDVALKSAVIAVLALLAARVLRRRSAAERSSVLHGGLVAMALLPVLLVATPRWRVELPVLAMPAAADAAGSTADAADAAVGAAVDTGHAASAVRERKVFESAALESVTRSARVLRAERALRDAHVGAQVDTGTVWGVLYALPALALLLGLAMSLSRLRALRDRSTPLRDLRWAAALRAAQQRSGVRGRVELLHSPDAASPLSWGVRRRIIVLDATAIAPESADALLAHELAHLARQDWIKLLFARLVTALFWFNPFAWLLARRCHQLREEAADDAVLRGEVAGVDYADLLLRFARNALPQQRVFAAHAIFSGRGAITHLSQRLQRVLDDEQRRAPAVRAWSAGCAAVSMAIALPLAALAPVLAPAHAAAPVAASAELHAKVPLASVTTGGDLTFTIGARRRAQPGVVQVTFEDHTPRGRSTHSSGLPLATLQGLTEATLAADAPQVAAFRVVRAAGTLDCEGSARRGVASGTCRFLPDAAFARELERRGVGRVSAREQLQLALQDARLDVLDELARQGYDMPDTQRFVELSIHDVDVAWLKGLASVDLTADNLARLVEFRIHDIDAAYVGALRAAGYGDLTARRLIEFRVHDITGESIAALAAAGFSGLSARDLVNFHIHEVTPEFAQQMKALGYGTLSPERLVEFRIHEVTPDFIHAVNAVGYHDVAPRDLVSLRVHDITPAWISEQLARGGERPDIDDLVQRKIFAD